MDDRFTDVCAPFHEPAGYGVSLFCMPLLDLVVRTYPVSRRELDLRSG